MKRMIATILLMVLAFGFTGCGSAAVSSDLSSSSSVSSESSSEVSGVFDPAEHTLAICMGSITHPIYRIVQLGFIESAEKLGYRNIPVSGLVEGRMAELIEKWNSDVVKNDVDGIVMWTWDDSCYELMREWHDQGIKIVVPYFEHDYNETHEFIDANPAGDAHSMGADAADFLVERLQEQGITSGVLGFSQNSSAIITNYYLDGFCERLEELGCSFTVLDRAFEGAEPEWAASQIQKYIEEYPEMVGAFGSTYESTYAWGTAKGNLNRQDIIVVGLDYTARNLDILKSGEVEALVGQPVYDSGYESAVMLDELLRGTVFDESSWNIDLGLNLITADGEGVNGSDYYYDLYTRCDALDWDKYLT